MNELQIFNSEEFGDIRTVTIDNEPFFCMADICKALEISNVSQVKTRLNVDVSNALESIDWQKIYHYADNFGKDLATFLNGLITPRLFMI